MPLSRRGRLWSYTDNRYQPPAAVRLAQDPFEPYAVAAVELEREKMVVLGQVVPGVGRERPRGRAWRWSSCSTRSTRTTRTSTSSGSGSRPARERVSSDEHQEVAILGVGMHPWGKWGRNFVEYGVHAAQAALADAGLDVDATCSSSPAARRSATATRASSPASSFAQALGCNGAQVASTYGACATGAQAIEVARAQILAGLCDVALVVGADTTPKGFFAPTGSGERMHDPDWLRFRLLGATNPIYFGLYARRRMDLFGATERDFAQVKVKNSRHGFANPNARYKKLYTRGGGARVADGLRPAAPARHLRDQRRRRGARAVEHGVRAQAHARSP